ncbi:MAG TPA: dTDP-4-dehydrorhamnose reductase [Solirubrobacteraceae bacterium]|nr:dTDP-4-dehydrorhamnose reductase [Solirubrobacteraceae bacterium]
MKALITGGGGQLASDLATILGPDARTYAHAELDITDSEALDRAFAEVQPDVVFNCAAFHNVDVCEREPTRSWEVNVEAVRALAARSPLLVHVSTNYVFDGRRDEPYDETDLPAPRSVYALTKLAGEYAALGYAQRALVVRTGGLYGLNGSESKGGNFVQRMIKRARDQGALKVVSDQCLQPTFTADLAAAMVEAVGAGATGIVHLTAGGACSWHEFTGAIMQRAGIDVAVEPTATVIAAGGVDRPLNGVMARRRADALGLTPLRAWDEALTDYMERAGLASPNSPINA